MAQFYEMPAISPTMEVGTLLQWRVKEGQTFESSAVVAEIGTDKANMEAEIFDPGVMLKHLVAEGDEIPPGYPIAIVGAAGDDISGLLAEFEKRKAAGSAPKAEPAKAAPSTSEAPKAAPPQAEAPKPETPKAESRPSQPPQKAATTDIRREWMGTEIHRLFADPPGDLKFGAANGRVAASPLARKLAADKGVDLAQIRGTGPGGRVSAADVEQTAVSAKPAGAPSAAAPPSGRADEVVRNSPMRKTIAKRLLESHQSIPTFFLTAAFDTGAFVELREDLKDKVPDLKVSYNDLLVLAVARALREHPRVNASWGDKEIVRHGRVDIGIAVAMEDGLITPVVRDADHKSLTQVAGEIRELAGRARVGKLQPDEYTGSTFTISNLGMFGIEQFTAIINPPESAILAVGAMEQVPVAVDGGFEPGWRMKVTMTCDHRVIDGAVGAAFLQTLRRYVESPWLLLV
ncbi:MAG: dihydrolipoamide acetyltransferase family protein [Myxococcota bacterium]